MDFLQSLEGSADVVGTFGLEMDALLFVGECVPASMWQGWIFCWWSRSFRQGGFKVLLYSTVTSCTACQQINLLDSKGEFYDAYSIGLLVWNNILHFSKLQLVSFSLLLTLALCNQEQIVKYQIRLVAQITTFASRHFICMKNPPISFAATIMSVNEHLTSPQISL